MARKVSCALLTLVILVGVGLYGAWSWLQGQIKPMPEGKPFYVRFEDSQTLAAALMRLQTEGVIRNADATRIYLRLKKKTAPVAVGTYQVQPGMSVNQVYLTLKNPIKQMVRLPDTNWAARTANILEKHEVTTAAEYMELVHHPEQFEKDVDFPLPKNSLEGYLYPDTYDLPPLLGARETILRQLKTFQDKVYDPLGKPKGLHRLVTVASMVELEVMKDDERPRVAGVIENRLRKDMFLGIDAALLYGIQKWRILSVNDYKAIDSPYNVYTHKGLPPGPICSPTVASIKAALRPEKHGYLYYVAMPGTGHHLFAPDYDGHLANIYKVRQARKAIAMQAVSS
jgi:UPF0755 protein